nr:MAG TPA: hypothetical protein [Caudoviricetes sp.]
MTNRFRCSVNTIPHLLDLKYFGMKKAHSLKTMC